MMRYALYLFLLLTLVPSVMRAQSGQPMASPRTVALLWSDVADATDMRAPTPAMRPDTSSRVEADLMTTPTGLAGSWTAGLSGHYAVTSLDRLGASFSRYQFQDIYSSEIIGVQYSRTFLVDSLRRASGGIRLRYGSQDFGPQYVPLNDLTMDFGVSFDLNAQLALGFAATHILSLYNNQGIQTEHRTEFFGLSYRSERKDRSSKFILDAAAESSESSSIAMHVGVEYSFALDDGYANKYLSIRAGVETLTHLLAGGFGIMFGETQLDFVLLHHPDLGSSLSFGLSYPL